MTGFEFSGETDSLSPRQIEFLCDILKKRNFKDCKIEIKTLGKAGDNYAANVKRIIVERDDGEILQLVAKIAPKIEQVRAIMNTVPTFKNECFMYTDVLPKLVGLQRNAGVPEAEQLRFAECYGVMLETLEEIILLEDLHLSNFSMLDRFKPLTNECIRLILKNFAILHSLSFVLKKQDPELFEFFDRKLFNYYLGMKDSPDFHVYFQRLKDDTLAVLDSEKYKEAVLGLMSQFIENMVKVHKNDNMKHFVIIQGDGWTNNMMFKMKDDGAPTDCVMIDYQISKAANPVSDILYMLFSSTNHETRHHYFHDWIDYYYKEFDESLHHFGMKANFVYPRSKLDADLKIYSKVFFNTAIMLSSVLIRKSEDVAQLKKMYENSDDMEKMLEESRTSNLDPQSIELFKERVEDMIASYSELGYFE